MSDDTNVTLDAELEGIFTKIDALSLGKAAQLVKAMEQRWGVSAAAPAAVAVAPAQAAEAAEEKTEFDVIKVVREITGLGLKEAKSLVEEAPKPVKEGASKDEAQDIKKKLTDVGAEVELK